MTKLKFTLIEIAALFLLAAICVAQSVVDESSTVTADMTMKLNDGSVVATTEGKQPVTFRMGQSQMLPSIQKNIIGMAPGESKKLTLPPDQAFGQGNPDNVKKMPNEQIPEDLRVPGERVNFEGERGQAIPGRVVEVGENRTTVDFNHPLAGRTIVVEVKVVEVR